MSQQSPVKIGRPEAGIGQQRVWVGLVSLANLTSKAALYGSLSRSGKSRGNGAERQRSSAYRIQPITIV
jgi:hypothetical protein